MKKYRKDFPKEAQNRCCEWYTCKKCGQEYQSLPPSFISGQMDQYECGMCEKLEQRRDK